jgi:hypothetical protein
MFLVFQTFIKSLPNQSSFFLVPNQLASAKRDAFTTKNLAENT